MIFMVFDWNLRRIITITFTVLKSKVKTIFSYSIVHVVCDDLVVYGDYVLCDEHMVHYDRMTFEDHVNYDDQRVYDDIVA